MPEVKLSSVGCGCTAHKKKCRPPGSPAGTWPHTPWYHTFFHDAYEAVNVWSHLLPGIFFLCLAVRGYMTGILAYAIFGVCAAITHLCSTMAHVYPDSHAWEKLDHFGITGLIIGTSVSAIVARQHGGAIPHGILYASAALLIAAMLRPVPRVIGYIAGSAFIVVKYAPLMFNANLGAQLCLHLVGAWCFLRNSGHYTRWFWLTDHHILHYVVTSACLLHVQYINVAMKEDA